MRIDRRLNRDVLTERQLYFTECWSNFCHKNSPDTDRVGYSNPLNTIRELLFLYEMEDRFSADKKRLRVATELLELLETDQVLRREAFEDIPAQLVSLLDRDLLVDPTRSPVEKRPRLICSLCVQLADITEASYITEALERGAKMQDQLFNLSRFDGRKNEISSNMDYPPLRAFFRRLSRECGFTVSPHRFRHTIATNLMRLPDRNLKMAQDLLGHSTPAVTLEYVESDLDKVRDMLEELDAA